MEDRTLSGTWNCNGLQFKAQELLDQDMVAAWCVQETRLAPAQLRAMQIEVNPIMQIFHSPLDPDGRHTVAGKGIATLLRRGIPARVVEPSDHAAGDLWKRGRLLHILATSVCCAGLVCSLP